MVALDIADTDRIVTTIEPLALRREVVPQRLDWWPHKPRGLWYACGRGWMTWAVNANWNAAFNFVYRLRINDACLLRVTSLDEFEAFEDVYATVKVRDMLFPDWRQIAAEGFVGFEICPFWKARYITWYYTWDVASGCIWDTRAICDVERMLG